MVDRPASGGEFRRPREKPASPGSAGSRRRRRDNRRRPYPRLFSRSSGRPNEIPLINARKRRRAAVIQTRFITGPRGEGARAPPRAVSSRELSYFAPGTAFLT